MRTRLGHFIVTSAVLGSLLAAGTSIAAPSAAVAAGAARAVADVVGPPGYAMAEPSASAITPSGARAAVPINASYAHSPTPSSQPDLPPGGPTMHSLTIYLVYWLPGGHFGSSAADDTAYQNLLNRFAGDLGGSQYYNLVTQYYDTTDSNNHITSAASFGGAWLDTTNALPRAGDTTTPLAEGDITDEVHRAVAANGWTEDINHIVAVFTANGIQECDGSGTVDGHCTFPVGAKANGEFCAYHSHFSDSGTDALFAYMSYDDQFHGAGQTCVAGETGGDTDPNRSTYPNANKGADAEASTLSHELIEAVTDPHPNDAWTASDGEIGDKCNFNYTPRNDNGADVFLNGHPYILQQEYSNAVHTCAIDLNGSGIYAPSVSLTKTVDDPAPKVTRTATYTITLNNTNDSGAATNLSLTDNMPSGYVITSLSAPGSTSSSSTTGSVSVSYDTLAVHQSRTVTVQVTVPKPAGVGATNCGALSLQDLLGGALPSQTTAPCATTTPVLIPASLTNTGATTQDYHDPATVSARLTDDASTPLSGQTVTFTLNGSETCTATTDATGNATCNVTPGEPAGSYPLVASFAGSDTYGATNQSTTFLVTREETATAYTGPTIVANAKPVTLSGTLAEDGVTPIVGRTLTLTLGTGGSAQSCSGATDATGKASCTISSVSQPLRPGTVRADFAGDTFYLPSSSGPVATIMFQYTSGGSFVAGDRTIGPIGSSIGKHITFWSATWPQLNSMSAGTAPASFKGFEDSTVLPSVGTPWTTDPGNSIPPPATVPTYTAIIVASSVNKSGSVISGNDLHIVIVHVDPGYGPQPSTPGTATIVAVLA